jgi:hypothetical protein
MLPPSSEKSRTQFSPRLGCECSTFRTRRRLHAWAMVLLLLLDFFCATLLCSPYTAWLWFHLDGQLRLCNRARPQRISSIILHKSGKEIWYLNDAQVRLHDGLAVGRSESPRYGRFAHVKHALSVASWYARPRASVTYCLSRRKNKFSMLAHLANLSRITAHVNRADVGTPATGHESAGATPAKDDR